MRKILEYSLLAIPISIFGWWAYRFISVSPIHFVGWAAVIVFAFWAIWKLEEL